MLTLQRKEGESIIIYKGDEQIVITKIMLKTHNKALQSGAPIFAPLLLSTELSRYTH